jgi:hypothetical protein
MCLAEHLHMLCAFVCLDACRLYAVVQWSATGNGSTGAAFTQSN